MYRVETPTLGLMRQDCGEEFVVNYLASWIITLNDMLNLGNSMKDAQVEYAAKMILDENPLLTVADIKFIFDSAVTGKYGLLYNRLDTQIVCTWFRKHWEERLDCAENESIMAHQRITQAGDYERSSTRATQRFREARKKWETDRQTNSPNLDI